MNHLHHVASAKRGSALLTSVALLTMMSVLVLGYLSVAVDSHKWTDQQGAEKRLENAGESLISLAVNQIWGDFERTRANQANTTTWDFREYLDGLGIADRSTIDPNDPAGAAEAQGGLLAGATSSKSKWGAESASALEALKAKSEAASKGEYKKRVKGKDIRDVVKLPTSVSGRDEFHSVDVDSLTITRADTFDQVRLVFEVTVSVQGSREDGRNRGDLNRTVQEAFVIQAGEWDGMEYALLSNNINCVMCHTDIDNAERFYNQDPLRYNTFDRVKLGSIESMQFRSDPHSSVAGTMYLQGDGLKSDGSRLTNWSGLNLKTSDFDSSGKLIQDQWGNLVNRNLNPADAVDPQALENLYLAYGEGGQQPDGFMPETFPSPFPDNGGYDFATGKVVKENAGNRIVDKSEFMATVNGSDGSISGGAIGVLPQGDKITTQNQLDSFMNPADGAVLPSITDGTVFLRGTEANPILLNGDVAIDGDVVIMGVIKGRGAIRASGNVYMPSDVTYQDGTGVGGARSFGVSQDGGENVLAIASGGNVMVGNIFHPAWGSGPEANGYSSGSYNFIMEELALFNRTEWMKSKPTLPGKVAKVQTGATTKTKKVWKKVKVPYQQTVNKYKWVKTGKTKKVPIYKWVTIPSNNGSYGAPKKKKVITGYKTKHIKKKVKVGTKTITKHKWVKSGTPTLVTTTTPIYEWKQPDLANPYYRGADYIPRYYSFTEDSTIPILNKKGYLDPVNGVWMGKEHAGGWKSEYLTYANPKNKNEGLLYNSNGSSKAVVSTLTGSSWISDGMLKSLLKTEVEARDKQKPLEIDAILYSNNSIFGIIPVRNAKGLQGEMILNGAIVAADLGLLSPKSFKLNYDPRGRDILNIASDNVITLKRILWAPMAP